ncbi:uncharacterized protein LOC101851521 [Aplysia californica]|uniref:Uncharacterized protein LOC101851521 n=1 Tax=Aplysia californica TaxID=6500 RepID=A0ABM0JYS0_APLCA|nr:uncharacterized protein LOC101851521 [Aplysia californica]
MEGRYNTRSPAVKRLMREAQELSEPTDQYFAQPLEDNLFEWHFTVRGPADSDFQSGIYHGRIILPVDYPMKPPSIIWLTPNGRFETNKKICLSISGHHPESWQPSWSIRTALLAIIGFMPTHPGGAIGSLDYTPEERKTLAKKSRDWKCPSCGDVQNNLLEPSTESKSTSQEAKELAAQINFQGEKSKKSSAGNPVASSAAKSSNLEAPVQTSPSNVGTAGGNNPVTATPAAQTTPFPLPFPRLSPWGTGTPAQAMPGSQVWNPSAMSQPSGVAAMMPRFPYPPSHYPSGYTSPFYPSGFPMPGGLNMFPYPFPAPLGMRLPSHQNTSPPHPVNTAASEPANAGPADLRGQGVSTSSSTSQPRYTRSPMVSSLHASPSRNLGAAAESPVSESDVGKTESPAKDEVMAELLSKVKRVGSADLSQPQQNAEEKAAGLSVTEEVAVKPVVEEIVGDCSLTEETGEKKSAVSHGHTNSEVSPLVKKKESLGELTCADLSHPDLPTDAEENSEAGAPPLETLDIDQRSGLERSTSNSMPELESKRGLGGKGLRQRQSATARIPTEVAEDFQQEAGAAGVDGQRIEAESGDTPPRQRPRPNGLGNQVFAGGSRQNLGNENGARQGNSFDFSILLIVGLSLATILILLNRVAQAIDWS